MNAIQPNVNVLSNVSSMSVKGSIPIEVLEGLNGVQHPKNSDGMKSLIDLEIITKELKLKWTSPFTFENDRIPVSSLNSPFGSIMTVDLPLTPQETKLPLTPLMLIEQDDILTQAAPREYDNSHATVQNSEQQILKKYNSQNAKANSRLKGLNLMKGEQKERQNLVGLESVNAIVEKRSPVIFCPSINQKFDERLDSAEKKSLFIQILVLEMQLDQRIALEYLEKNPRVVEMMSRESLVERVLDYLFQMKRELQRENLSIGVNLQYLVLEPNQNKQQKKKMIFEKFQGMNMVMSEDIAQNESQQIEQIAIDSADNITPKNSKRCPICWICVSPNSMTQLSKNCSHGFCVGCLEKYVTFRVQEGRLQFITCPQHGCQSVFADKEIKKVLSPASFVAYNKLKRLSLLNNDPSIRYCTRSRNCSNDIRFQDNEITKECSCCQNKTCFKCYMPAHQSQTCEQAMRYKLRKLLHAVRQGSCPKCSKEISEVQISNQIKCKNCEHQFCWLCKQKAGSTHFSFWNVCYGCPNMDEGIEEPILKNRLKYGFKGFLRSVVVLMFCLLMLCGYIISLIILPFFLPGAIYLNYQYDRYDKYHISKKLLIAAVFLALGIVGYLLWLALCIVPGIFLAFNKFLEISEKYISKYN